MDFKFIPSDMVEVPEIPYQEQIQLPADRTALIMVDMENDFVKPDGSLVVPADGISALTEFDQALTLRQVANLYAGQLVCNTKDIIFSEEGV